METTTLRSEQLRDQRTADQIRRALEGEQGVARVLARADRGEIYVRHSRAKMPRQRLLDRLQEDGIHAEVKDR